MTAIDASSRAAAPTAQTAATPALQSVAGRLPLVIWLYLLAVIIPIMFQAGPLTLSGLRLLLMVMIIPVLFRLFTGHYGRLIATDFLFILHLIWTMVALAANNPSAVIEQTGSTGVEFLGGYALGRAYIRSRADFAALIRALLLIVITMLPFAMFETLTSRSLWLEMLRTLPGTSTLREIPSEARSLFGITLERVQGSFAHPIHFGLFCSIPVSLCVVGMKGVFSTPRRQLSGGALALAAILSLSSGALLAIILQFALILWALALAKVPSRWWILFGLAVLFYVAVDLASNRSPIRVFMSYATFSAHNAFWRGIIFEWGMKNVWANPIVGIGFNDWVRPVFMRGSSVDNFWLLMAMRYGIPGFLFLAMGHLWVIVQLVRRDFHADTVLRHFRLAWVFTIIGLSFTLCTVHVWGAIYSFTFFIVGAGVWMMTVLPEDGDTQPETEAPTRQGSVFARNFKETPRAASPDRKPDPARYSRFPRSDRTER